MNQADSEPSFRGKQPSDEQEQQEPSASRAVSSMRNTARRTTKHGQRARSPPTPSFPTSRRQSTKKHSSPRRHAGPRKGGHDEMLPPPVASIETTIRAQEVQQQHRPTQRASDETDYYRSPTMLGRYIVNQKYGNAVKRAFQHPEEARIWLCSRRTKDGDYTIRQLPIHIACNSLMCSYDDRQTRLLNELIALLVFCNPEGSHKPDHRDCLPMLEALWYGAEPQTISVFFVAHPESLLMRDKKGRSLTDLNQHRSGSNKDQVQNLIEKGVSFWKRAREEAFIRLKFGDVRFPLLNTESVPSDIVLASSQAANETLYDSDEETSMGPADIADIAAAGEVLPLSWDQLEKRCIAAEKILTEVNERNYDLSRRVEALTTLEEVHTKVLISEVKRLEDGNADIIRKVRVIERMLEKYVLKEDNEETRGQLRLVLAEVSSLAALSDKSSLSGLLPEQLRMVKQQTKKLSQQQEEQREKIRKMKIILDAITQPSSDNEEGAEAENGDSTTSLTSKSNYSTEIKNTSRFLVDRTPSTRIDMRNPELDVIFKYGAIYDYARRYPDVLGEVTPDNDLEAILAWAALQESEHSLDEIDVATNYSPAKPASRRPTKRVRNQHHREIKLPALLPPILGQDDPSLEQADDSSSYVESAGASQETDASDNPGSHEEEWDVGILSETQVSL